MTLAEFLAFYPEENICYELENGELVEMPPESDQNQRIASFLFAYFLKLGIAPYCLRIGIEVAVTGSKESVRVPDFTVLSEEAALALEGATRSTIMPDMPPPKLVVEVVSPGKVNINRDYRYKRAQYQARGISEYWIVDPLTSKVTILSLNEGLYDEATFVDAEILTSPLLQELQPENEITAAQVLQQA
ncbi:hypothetical protein NIES208_00545 [[Limnothrix rosea] IAM M-220]|nr:hypothetical protein NIES208_00545 [[Limnothrix rosea] IAM M-220]